MKRKIALLLAAALTVSMLPMNAFASSSNSVKSGVTVRTDINNTALDVTEVKSNGAPVTLEIRPNDEITSTDSIILSIENGEFSEKLVDSDAYKWKSKNAPYQYWNDVCYPQALGDYDNILAPRLGTIVKNQNSSAIPYLIKFVDESQIEVKLCPVQDSDIQNSNKIAASTPRYSIALPIDVQDSSEGAVVVTIDGNGSNVTENSYTVATVIDDDGSTTASIASSNVNVTSGDTYTVKTITVKEDVSGTFKGGQDIKLRVNGNYTIKDGGTVAPGTNSEGLFNETQDGTAGIYVKSSNSRELVFTIPDSFNAQSDKLRSINFKNIVVTCDDEDKYGDIEFTISGGDGISRQVLKVGERADYGFALTALEEVPTIFAGRSFYENNDLDEDDYATAEFEFAETSPDTWLTSRKLEFSVPEGVKIVGYEITNTKYVNSDGKKALDEAVVVDDGTTLRFASLGDNALDESDCSYVDMKLYLSAAADFSGDVTVEVSGAGLDKDQLSPLTVAKVVTPITVEAASTTANLGYKAVETSDIVIKENVAGALLENKTVKIKLDDTYADDIAFDDADIDYTVDGEVEVKSFKVSNTGSDGSKIEFVIDAASYNNPSTITVSGIKVGTTRSIPYGSYSLIVAGDAVVNNYATDDEIDTPSTVENVVKLEKTTGKDANGKDNGDADKTDFDFFDVEGFEFKDYLTIKTETGTLDGKVEVTIGSNTIKMDGKEVSMDTAAYIQTASNSTMVPLRFVALAIGVDQSAVEDADNTSKITWDANNKVATILYAAGNGQKIIQFQANSPVMVIDGTAITMENGVKAEIVDGRMFVPFRALGTALGVPVTWDAETRTAIYNE